MGLMHAMREIYDAHVQITEGEAPRHRQTAAPLRPPGHHVADLGAAARADYEATRWNLRRLLPDLDEETFFRQSMLGAYGLMLLLSAGTATEPLHLRSPDDAKIRMNPGGYPTLQSRWDLMKAGIVGAPMPEFER